MESKFVLLVGLLVLLPVVDCSRADLKMVNASAHTGLNPKITLPWNETVASNGNTDRSSMVLNSTKFGKVKNSGDQVDGSKKGLVVENGKDGRNSSGQSSSSKADDVQKGEGRASEESKGKEGDNEKDMESKDVPRKVGNEGDVVSSTSGRNEGSRGEECDISNRCTDEDHKLVACLRVPGDESPNLLLLIQNKGKGPLVATISAPDFVQLEERKVQIQEKGHKKVKVYITEGGTDSLIIITAGSGNCSLDFRDLIAHNTQGFGNTPKLAFISFMKRSPRTALVLFASLLILVSAWTCISFKRKHFSGNGSKYQKLEMELPVSIVEESEVDSIEGWDNSWGDGWNDEEAPRSPPMPHTPSLSAKGLASRRLNKEGWRD
ncbi:uncharacterized protein LOC122290410 [Carya illinoinensis]|uniref:DUF7356 domain-containing protein n=1 Tax=Carya illinoinensis TaxID=32201 RepID=A0A8T1NPE3_CARIL|nr:uncharacterized protein LOC122290410 [Carya illinoinensis]KAG6633946.1 hypothetical protein CIPAW_12G083800 [Carya illinoinensis]